MDRLINICLLFVVSAICVGCSLGGTATGYLEIKTPTYVIDKGESVEKVG